MQRAGQQRAASAHATPATPPVRVLEPTGGFESLQAEVLLTDAVVLARAVTVETAVDEQRLRTLELAIRQRIESRVRGRVRNLNVRVFEGVVILEGQCATYYTKQLAQHAALGLLEDEQLENAIVVQVPR
jgi:osmotically-inducible protein OsmY